MDGWRWLKTTKFMMDFVKKNKRTRAKVKQYTYKKEENKRENLPFLPIKFALYRIFYHEALVNQRKRCGTEIGHNMSVRAREFKPKMN